MIKQINCHICYRICEIFSRSRFHIFNLAMKNEIDFLFLLGGHDLEMVEIRNMLDRYKQTNNPPLTIHYLDHDLSWGAGLSSYSNGITEIKAGKIAGIELAEDIPVPKNYLCIDHHGERSELPSSLEQIATLLGLTLSRYQQIVAINDRLYIPGMADFGATKEEIELIRHSDRKSQGVTETDEWLAATSVQDHLSVKNGITVVKALTSKFSTITDRLYPTPKLIVYNDQSLVYYGIKAGKLQETFSELKAKHLVYSGGGADGFFGFTETALSFYPDKEKLINTIIQTVSYE